MELSDLEIFRTVVAAGGISAAADKLHRVPSNITARIQKLENELDKQLFIRDKNRLRISPAGSQLLNYADKILALADQAIQELNHTTPRGQLTIGSMESIITTRLPQWLNTYHKTYPEVSLRVKAAPTGDSIQQVLAGEFDVAFVADPPKDTRLASQLIVKDQLLLVSDSLQASIKHPDDIKGNISLLGFNPSCAYRNKLQAWLEQSERAFEITEIGSYFALLSCVSAGMGVGLVAESLLNIYPFRDSLKIHKLPVKWSSTTTKLIWRKDNTSPNVAAFAELVSANTYRTSSAVAQP